MIVAVAGATGLVGTSLVRSLLRDGHEVRVLTRNPAAVAGRLPVACVLESWDADASSLRPEVLAGADAVVNLAGAGVADTRWSDARKREILDSRVGGGAAICAALSALAPAHRPRVLISSSAVGYYGDRGDEAVDERAGRGQGFLADVCEAWENAAAAAARHHVRVVVLRTGVVLAREGGALARMLPPFRLGMAGRLGSGRQWMSWIHIDDLVRMIRFALENDELSGPINAVSPVPITNAAFTRALGRTLQRPTLVPVPGPALRLAMGELSSMLLTGQRVVPAVAKKAGFDWRYPEIEGALPELCNDLSYRIAREQWVAAPLEEVFEFFSDAYNLERITPPLLRFQVLGVDTESLQEGTQIRYKLRVHGVPVRWRSRIEEWHPPHQFADRQIRGPYGLWHHTHTFSEQDGGTLMRDRVRYKLPFGALGDALAAGLVQRDLRAIFDFRYHTAAQLFST